jgi:hypothetical protein
MKYKPVHNGNDVDFFFVMYHLPQDLINLIYEFDGSKRENYNRVLEEDIIEIAKLNEDDYDFDFDESIRRQIKFFFKSHYLRYCRKEKILALTKR